MGNVCLRVCLICALLATVSCNKDNDSNTSPIEVGDMLPYFKVELSDGKLYDSSLADTIPQLIVFFHTSCPDCQKELPVLQQLFDDRTIDFRLLLISREEPSDEIEKYWNENRLTIPYTAQTDRTIYNKFADTGIPRGYLVNRQNRVAYTFTDKDMPALEQLRTKIQQTND